MFTKKVGTTLAAVLLAVSALSSARAASVSFTNTYADSSGTGNGVVLGVLSLQQHANGDSEFGFTGWNPTKTNTNLTPIAGDAGAGTTDAQTQYILGHTFASDDYSKSQKAIGTNSSDYFSRSAASLTAAGINASNFAVVFQVNESNGALTLNRFDVNFYNADGSLDFTAHYPDPVTDAGLILDGTGQGTSGWVFAVINFADPTETSWFSGEGYVGIAVSAQHAVIGPDSGADNFFLGKYPSTTDGGGGGGGNGAPLPAAVWGGMSLMGALGLGSKLRKWMRRA